MKNVPGLVRFTIFGSDLKKWREAAQKITDPALKETYLKYLDRKARTRPIKINNIRLLLDEIYLLLSRCDIPDSVLKYTQSLFEKIKAILDGDDG